LKLYGRFCFFKYFLARRRRAFARVSYFSTTSCEKYCNFLTSLAVRHSACAALRALRSVELRLRSKALIRQAVSSHQDRRQQEVLCQGTNGMSFRHAVLMLMLVVACASAQAPIVLTVCVFVHTPLGSMRADYPGGSSGLPCRRPYVYMTLSL
jgi:hypothetical protein